MATHDRGSPTTRFIAPGATLGVMGGGQLGRMFVHAAQRLGYFTAVLDPDPASPAGLVAHYHIDTDYLDEQGLAQLMQRCDAITTEFENVPAQALARWARTGPWRPARRRGGGVPGPRRREGALRALRRALRAARVDRDARHSSTPCATALLPGILKTARLGYDGKGQVAWHAAPSWPPPGTALKQRALRAREAAAAGAAS